MRTDVQFQSQGLNCAAWFYDGAGASTGKAPRPCIVMAHGLAGVKEMRLDAYAERFAAAGYSVLVFDYRHFGASEGEPRQLLSIAGQLQDWRAAIAHARSLPQVDASKIVLWGSSLSGGHVLATAHKEPGVVGVISQVPHFSGVAGLLATGPVQGLRLTAHGLFDVAGKLLGRAPHYVHASGKPGELALLAGPGDSEGYLKLHPSLKDFDQRVAARFALTVGFYSPGRLLPKLAMPSLIQVGLDDHTTPPGPVIAACRKAPRATLKQYPAGHFTLYVEPLFSRIITDQLDFLATLFGKGV